MRTNVMSSCRSGLRVWLFILLCSFAVCVPDGHAQVFPDSLRRTEVTYRNGTTQLAATLLQRDTSTTAPAIVIVHGSGTSARDNPWTAAYAEALALRGIVVLHPDKRGSGESTGSWRTASIHDLAGDVAAGLAFLRQQPGVDSARIGILAFSQGGYVAAVVAAQEAHNGFTAVISGGTASLRNQIVDEVIIEAEGRGQPLTTMEVGSLRNLYGRLFRFAIERTGWAEYTERVATAQSSGGALAHAVRTLPTDSTVWVFEFIRQMGDFDPMPYWRRVERPTVFVFGRNDTQVRVDESLERLRRADREQISTIVFGRNGHALFRADLVAFLSEWIENAGGS